MHFLCVLKMNNIHQCYTNTIQLLTNDLPQIASCSGTIVRGYRSAWPSARFAHRILRATNSTQTDAVTPLRPAMDYNRLRTSQNITNVANTILNSSTYVLCPRPPSMCPTRFPPISTLSHASPTPKTNGCRAPASAVFVWRAPHGSGPP